MPAAPYPVLETVVNYVRDIVNDAIIAGGQTFKDTQAFTIDYINLGYIAFQQFLVAQGFVTEIDETIVGNLPAVATLDPGQFVSLSWSGYNPGNGLQAGLVLPQNLIRPLKMWERPSAIAPAQPGVFSEMSGPILGGLEAVPKLMWNDQWEWRADAIWMPGARTATDLRIQFAKYFQNFVANSVTPFANQVVPVLRCEVALAGFIAYKFCAGRGDTDAAMILADAKEQAMTLVSLDSLQGRLKSKDSERGKMQDRYSGEEGKPS